MAQYRVLQRSFVNNALLEEGAIVEYDGEPSDNLELIKASKKSAKAEAAVTEEAPADAEAGQATE